MKNQLKVFFLGLFCLIICLQSVNATTYSNSAIYLQKDQNHAKKLPGNNSGNIGSSSSQGITNINKPSAGKGGSGGSGTGGGGRDRMTEAASLLNGGLSLTETDIATYGRGWGASVTRRYNSKIWAHKANQPFPWPAGGYATCLSNSSRIGLGWDFHPGKIIKGLNDNKEYFYFDGQGIGHPLVQIETGGSDYASNDGSYLHAKLLSDNSWLLRNKSGAKLVFKQDEWTEYTDTLHWNIQEITDTYGNKTSYCWSTDYTGLGEQLDMIVTSANRKIYFYYGEDAYLDSVRTLSLNGKWKTVKYEYETCAISNPFGGVYYDENSPETIYSLKKVVNADGTYVEYSYNSSGELETIKNSSLGVTSYAYGEYTYNPDGGFGDGTTDCKTRQVIQMVNSPDDGASNYTTTYKRRVNVIVQYGNYYYYTNPDSVTVTSPDNTKTVYQFKSSVWGNNPIDNGVLLETTVYDAKNTEMQKTQSGYKIRDEKEILLDSTATIAGTKKYVTRYRDYDEAGNPQRIDNLGDMSTTADDNYIYREYLHNQSDYIVSNTIISPSAGRTCKGKVPFNVNVQYPWNANKISFYEKVSVSEQIWGSYYPITVPQLVGEIIPLGSGDYGINYVRRLPELCPIQINYCTIDHYNNDHNVTLFTQLTLKDGTIVTSNEITCQSYRLWLTKSFSNDVTINWSLPTGYSINSLTINDNGVNSDVGVSSSNSGHYNYTIPDNTTHTIYVKSAYPWGNVSNNICSDTIVYSGENEVDAATTPEEPVDPQVNTISYNPYKLNHIYDRVSRQYVKSDTLLPDILSEVEYTYDTPVQIALSGYSPAPRQWSEPVLPPGSVTKIKQWKGGTEYDSSLIYYDQCGNAVKTINPKGDSSKVYYSQPATPDKYNYALPVRSVNFVEIAGNLDSLCSSTEYDTATGLALSATDANGQNSYFDYDHLGRLVKSAKPGDWTGPWPGWTSSVNPSTVRHYYDLTIPKSICDSVRLTGTTYAVSKTFYDGFGRSVQNQNMDTDGKAIINYTIYDNMNRVEKVSNPMKIGSVFGYMSYSSAWPAQADIREVRFLYDAMGRRTKILYQDGTRDSISYIANGVISFNALNQKTVVRYNSFGSPDLVKDALWNTTLSQYDHMGRVQSVTDAQGKVTSYYYDILGRLKGSNSPDVNSTFDYNGHTVDGLVEYDALGNISSSQSDKGVINYSYDKLNRVTKIDSAGVAKLTYVYDTYQGTNYYPTAWVIYCKGRLTMVVNEGVDTTFYAYDALGRLREQVISYAGMTGRKIFRYIYNVAGAVTHMQYPDGTTIQYQYGQTGRLDSIPNFVSQYNYNSIGLLDNVVYNNGQTTGYGYDSRLRSTRIASSAGGLDLIKLGYQFYPDGKVQQITDSLDYSLNQSFNYDAIGQLTSAVVAGQNLGYTYDNVGNRLSETVNGVATNYSYVSGTNRLNDVSGGINYGWAYDNLGSVTARSDGKSYSYDYTGQLAKYSFGSTTADFAYNSAGKRIKKQVVTKTIIGGAATDAAVIPETYDDLTLTSPNGDSLHDNARDIGQVKFHMNNNFVFFEIDHKYLYGTNQGDYSKIFISIDTDTIEGSGNTYFPESVNTQVLPQAAWEYCLYINSEQDFGYYDGWYSKHSNPSQMQVNFIPSSNGKAHIKVPKSIIGDPKYVRFVIMTTKPGLVNPDSSINGTSTATDVCPGGMSSLEGGIIYNYAEYVPPKPGTVITITTIKTTYYIYSGNNVLCELSPDGSTIAKYIYGGGGKLIAKADAFGRHFYTPDALGSCRIVTNLSGQVEQKGAYYPFGSQLTDSGTAVTNYKYTGKEWDGEEGLYYYGARYYDPEIGRFCSIDPMGGPAASPYAYCNNNPMNFVDPTGMIAWPMFSGELLHCGFSGGGGGGGDWGYGSMYGDDDPRSRTGGGGWTDASGDDVEKAMDTYYNSPEMMWNEANKDNLKSADQLSDSEIEEAINTKKELTEVQKGKINLIKMKLMEAKAKGFINLNDYTDFMALYNKYMNSTFVSDFRARGLNAGDFIILNTKVFRSQIELTFVLAHEYYHAYFEQESYCDNFANSIVYAYTGATRASPVYYFTPGYYLNNNDYYFNR